MPGVSSSFEVLWWLSAQSFMSWQGAHPLSLTGPHGHRHYRGRRHVLDAGQPSGEAPNALKPPSLASQRPAFPTLSCPPLPACIDRAAPMRDPHIPVLLARLRVDPARPRPPSVHRTAAFLMNAHCGRDVEVSRTSKQNPTDVGGRWRLAIVLRHRRRPEEASKEYPGEAPYTNRGLRHVGEAPLTNRGSAT